VSVGPLSFGPGSGLVVKTRLTTFLCIHGRLIHNIPSRGTGMYAARPRSRTYCLARRSAMPRRAPPQQKIDCETISRPSVRPSCRDTVTQTPLRTLLRYSPSCGRCLQIQSGRPHRHRKLTPDTVLAVCPHTLVSFVSFSLVEEKEPGLFRRARLIHAAVAELSSVGRSSSVAYGEVGCFAGLLH